MKSPLYELRFGGEDSKVFLKRYFTGKIIFNAGILAALLLLAVAPGLNAKETLTRKVIVFILDNISLRDLKGEGLVNFNMMIDNGSLGLMNARTGALLSSNRASAYLTIGMGVRTEVPDQETAVINKNKSGPLYMIEYPDAENLKKLVIDDYPNYVLGKIGQVAKQNGVKIALVGNSDTDRPMPHASLLAMDEKGNIPTGNTSRELLLKDPVFPWGYRTNPSRLLDEALKALTISDVVFIDFGDTARLEEAAKRKQISNHELSDFKAQSLKTADSFLGELFKKTAGSDLVLMVISPAPSSHDISAGNKTLTPVLIYEAGKPAGVLTSMTTRRSGLVANIDIGPTIFYKLGLNEEEFNFLGERITTVPDESNYETVAGNLSGYIAVKRSRYVVHGMYVLLLTLTLVPYFLNRLKGSLFPDGRAERVVSVMVLALPAASYIIPGVLKNRYPYLELFLIALVTVIIGVVLSVSKKRAFSGMAFLSLLTWLTLITYLLTRSGVLLMTPLGFNDVFTGGRYYGINNDSMGILLGATVFSLFYYLEMLKLNRIIRLMSALLVLGLVLLSQTPGFGANVGGSIAAMTIGVVGLAALISGQPIKKGKVLLVVAVVFAVEVFIAYLDSLFGQQTHAGKIFAALMSQDFGGKFMEILKSKLTLFGIMLLVPPWNLLLAGQVMVYYIITKRYSNLLQDINLRLPVLSRSFEVILIGGLVAFAFNDTGVIATGLMFTYMTMPLGLLLQGQKKGS